MPPARTPARAAARSAAGKAQPAPSSSLSRAFGRLRAGQPGAGQKRSSGAVSQLLRETRSELKKVEWPSRDEAVKLTGAVVGLSALVGIFLGSVDFLFQELFKLLIGLGNGV